MSTPPQETETDAVELTRPQRWVVHHVLTKRADDAIDDRESPPRWLLEAVDTVESGGDTFTRRQARKLHDAVTAYADADETPERDRDHATAIARRLAGVVDVAEER